MYFARRSRRRSHAGCGCKSARKRMQGVSRRSRFATRVWLFLLAFGAVTGCSRREARHEPGVLVVTEAEQTGAFVRNFNPLLEAGDVRWPARHSMYEPLMVYEPLRG